MDDDGFINLRVVRNLLAGDGPVFNLGDRVEVFTSPLWIALLAAASALGVRPEHAAVWGGIALTTSALFFAERACFILHRHRKAELWPIGASIVAVVPAVWDYASSGLETGLVCAWLAGTFLAIAHDIEPAQPARLARRCATSALIGLGPLVRPELALYSLSFFVPLALAERLTVPARRRRRVLLAASALALPVGYQFFRMGYFGALTANTAIAKEAFRLNVAQGFCYARNFFGLYGLAAPLAVAAVALYALAVENDDDKTSRRVALLLAPAGAGVVHAIYVIAMGGDYMHGRMFLPPLFAALMPVALSPVPELAPRATPRRAFLARAAFMMVLVGWLPVCAFRLRVARENVCGIGDERGWYARIAKVDHPVVLSDYREHWFHQKGAALLTKITSRCPSIADGTPKTTESCRLADLGDEEHGTLHPPQAKYPLAETVDPRVGAVVGYSAVGIVGFLLPSTVHLVDHLGLGDPIAARIALARRGRPGHEKDLSNAWVAARFTVAQAGEDASVVAARHALACEPLAGLLRATRGRVDTSTFFSNLVRSFSLQRLRVPADPFEAEERFCGTRAPRSPLSGGAGGEPFRFDCPADAVLSRLRGTLGDGGRALATIEPVCAPLDLRRAPIIGRTIGKKTEGATAFDAVCPRPSAVVALEGRASNVVKALAVRCTPERGPTHPASGTDGVPFDVSCPPNTVAVGVFGRAGDLLDAIGLVCSTETAKAEGAH